MDRRSVLRMARAIALAAALRSGMALADEGEGEGQQENEGDNTGGSSGSGAASGGSGGGGPAPSVPSPPEEPDEGGDASQSGGQGADGRSPVDTATGSGSGSGSGVGGAIQQATSDPGQSGDSGLLGMGAGEGSSPSSALTSDESGDARLSSQATSLSREGADPSQVLTFGADFGGGTESKSVEGGVVGALIQFSPELDRVAVTGFAGEGAGVWASVEYDTGSGKAEYEAGVFAGLNDGNLDLMVGTNLSQPEPNLQIGILAGGQELSVGISGPALWERAVQWLTPSAQWLQEGVERMYGVPTP